MTVSAVLDAAGRRRSPATMPGSHAGRPPRNKGQLYPADPPTVEEIIAVMRQTADDRHGARLRALIVVLWRGGLRVREALALGERDLDPRRGSLLVRRGKGGRRREIGSGPRRPLRARPAFALGKRASRPLAADLIHARRSSQARASPITAALVAEGNCGEPLGGPVPSAAFAGRAGGLTAGRRGPPGSSFVVLSGRRGHRLALALLRRPGPPNPPQGCRP
jgi:hypothetical protein